MSEWIALLNAVSTTWACAMWRASWQGALALGLVWAICRLAPRLPASLRCWLWRIAYLKLLLALFWTTPVELRILPPRPAAAAMGPLGAEARPWGPLVSGPLPAAASPSAAGRGVPPPVGMLPAAPSRPLPGPVAVLFLLWLAGAGWYLARVNRQWQRTALLRRCCSPSRDPAAHRLLRELCERLRLRRTPELLSADVNGPLVMGVVRPAIVLPAGFVATEAEQEWILAHELAHVKRRDLLWAHLPVLTRVVFFFHPAVWVAHREWRITQEMACDALTVDLTAAPAGGYGEMLVKLATRQQAFPPAELGTAGILETETGLERRLDMLRTDRLSNRRLGWVAGIALAVGALSLVPWRLGAAPVSAAPQKVTPSAPARSTAKTKAATDAELARLRARTAVLAQELAVARREAITQRNSAQQQAYTAKLQEAHAAAEAPVVRRKATGTMPAPTPSRPAAPGTLITLTDRELLDLAGASNGGYSALIVTLSPSELLQYLRVEGEATMREFQLADERYKAGIAVRDDRMSLEAKVKKLEVLLNAAERRVKTEPPSRTLAGALSGTEMVQFLQADLTVAMQQWRLEKARIDAGASTASALIPLETKVKQLELLIEAAKRRAKGG